MTPSLDSLRALIAIGETGSFTEAARRLNSTQSTVSHQIRRLEAELGRKLIRRTTRSAALNPEGEVAFAHAKRVLERMDQLVGHFGGAPIGGTLRFGLAEDCLSEPLTALLRDFGARHPDLRLDIAIAPSARLAAGLEAHRLDLVLSRGIGEGPGEPLGEEPLVWAGRAAPGPGEVLPLALLDPPCLYRAQILAVLRAQAVRHKVVVSCSAHAVLRRVVAAGLGVTVMARSDLPGGLRALDPGPMLPELPRVQTRLILPAQSENPAAARLAGMLRREMALPD